jgi:hypothetical protein
MATVITFLPGWAIALLLFGLLSAMSWLGALMRQRKQFSGETFYAASAAVSLLALLIGFTFSLALNRYDGRRDLVVEEAAAIFAVWQRLPLLGEPQRSEMADLTRQYAEQRLEYFTFGIDYDSALRADRAADITVERMWVIVRSLKEPQTPAIIARMLMDNLTRIDDAAWRREAMGREHIPFFVVDLLVIFALMTAVSLGFVSPNGRNVHPSHLIFFGLTAASIVLLLDLDRPRSGLVVVSQRPMIEVLAIMTASDARISSDLRQPAPALPDSPRN